MGEMRSIPTQQLHQLLLSLQVRHECPQLMRMFHQQFLLLISNSYSTWCRNSSESCWNLFNLCTADHLPHHLSKSLSLRLHSVQSIRHNRHLNLN